MKLWEKERHHDAIFHYSKLKVSFYNAVLDKMFASPTPALASDALQTVPKLVTSQMCTRGVQVSVMSRFKDVNVDITEFSVQKVCPFSL